MPKQTSSERFVVTPYIQSIFERARLYLKIGLPLHLTGPAGTGKTTLALKLAKDINPKVYMIQGDDSLNRNDLVGGLFGLSQKLVEDNFISSVSKIEKRLLPVWVDNPVALACREGAVLIYDEFTRARPETNNLLLGILSEKVFMTTDENGRMTLERVHPDFSLILTSNFREYVGVNRAQDALIDRVVSVKLVSYDEESEALIVESQTDLEPWLARKIVKFVRRISSAASLEISGLRTSIKLGKIFSQLEMEPDLSFFFKTCEDIFAIETADVLFFQSIWNEK